MPEFRIAPFSLYSSSVETGYISEISASFRPHIDITNLHEDRYGNFADAPMQGPFTYKYVGGNQQRHVPLNKGDDTSLTRPELFDITMSSGVLTVRGPDTVDINRPRAPYYRGLTAKRPLNIENIQMRTGSTIIGNYSNDYEFVQTVGRTSNNRSFVEAEGVGFIGDSNLPYSGSLVTQFVTGARDFTTGTALPDFIRGETVFVNRFNAPGGTDVSSRGVLDTYAEEYAPNNAMPWRNHSVRSVLRSDLARHTPKATEISPLIPTEYHTDNRNTKLRKRSPTSQESIQDLVESAGLLPPSGIAVDTSAGKVYWVNGTTGKIYRANLDGTDVEDLVTLSFFGAPPSVCYIALDPSGGKMYWSYYVAFNTAKVQRANLDGSGPIEDLVNSLGSTPYFIEDIAIDAFAGKLYWIEGGLCQNCGGTLIRRADLDGTNKETVLGAATPTRWMDLDTLNGDIYWLDTAGTIRRNTIAGGYTETVLSGQPSTAGGIVVDTSLGTSVGKVYWAAGSDSFIRRANLNGSHVEDVLGSSFPSGIALDTSGHFLDWRIYWTDTDDDVVRRANMPEIPVYDNAYVTHAIPRCSLDYAWINASATTDKTQLPGYQNSSSVPYGPYTDIDFVLKGASNRGDFIGISGSALDKAAIGVFTCESGSVNFLSKSAGTMLNVYNGPYQYASWQQTRNSYNPIVRKLVENSILSIAATPNLRVSSQTGLPTAPKREGVLCYKLPIVRSSAKPLNHTLEVQPNINDPAITTSSFTYTYGNNLQSFLDPSLQNRLGKSGDEEKDSMYENMSTMYLDLGQFSKDTNPVRQFVKIDYSQILYPSSVNAFLNRTRTRTNYSEVSGTGIDGYDRTFGAQRTFFKEDQIRTFGVALNSQGYTAGPAGTGNGLVDSLNFNPMATDGLKSYPDSSSYENRDGELMMDTDITMNRFKPVPSLSFNELNYLYNAPTYLSGIFYSTDDGGVEHIFSRTKLSDTSWSDSFQVYNSPNDFANGIAVDAPNRKIYWTEFGSTTDDILSSSFDGLVQGVVCQAAAGNNPSDVRGIDVSPSRNRIVWCNRDVSNDIGIASLDGSLSGTIFNLLNDPYDIVIDQRSGKLYWVGASAATGSERVWTGNIDGTGYAALNSSIQTILATANGAGNTGIDLDPLSNTLYYVGEFGTNELRIHKSDLNGDNAALVLTQADAAFDVAVEVQVDPYGRRLYFTSFLADTDMYSCSLDNPGIDPTNNLYGKAFDGRSGTAKIAKAALYFPQVTASNGYPPHSASSGYVERLTEQISGKNPWYNNYEEYSADVRPPNKDMSILPEFKISDFIEYYVDENSNDFRAKNNKFLTLDGAFVTASAVSQTSSFDSSFTSKYTDSSMVNRLSTMISKHKDIAKVSSIEISCKGIKKLLPYEGFYPANRTVQLGSLLSQSLAANISGREDSLTSPRTPQGWQGILKPFMSPGILYNSIKSGIAVDYPVYTGSVPAIVDPTNETPSDFQFTQAPDYRLPFESLINLEGNLPVGDPDTDENGIRLVYSFATSEATGSLNDLFKYKSYWDGQKKPLFELGMHNFLAETVDFFLSGDDQGGKLTAFRSQPQPTDGWVLDPGKTYYMDVKLSDTAPMNKFVEYQGVKTINDFNWNQMLKTRVMPDYIRGLMMDPDGRN